LINIFRILLLPFSALYCIIISARNFFYNHNIFKSHKISVPVISIGNITTGGTGKSPFTVFIAEYFIKNGLKPAIISRGYKRESDSIEIVFDGNKTIGNPDKCGDEPIMMANRLSAFLNNFFIITGSDRVAAAEFAIDKFNPDLIILDDAFQHRKIKRDLDIVLIDSEDFLNNKFNNLFVLPSGNLRENIRNLKRADIIILNDKFCDKEKPVYFDKFEKEIFRIGYYIKGFFDKNITASNINDKNIIAFAGIAKPDSFFDRINSFGCKSVRTISFKDHYKYTEKDIKQLCSIAGEETVFVTTEKDFVKIKEFDEFLKYFSVLFMKIELNLKEESKFFGRLKCITKDFKN